MEAIGATSAASFGLAAIGQIGITVTDVNRAVAFYRDALGMKFLFQFPNMAFFDCGGVRLMLSAAERPAETYSSILYFKVADIHEARMAFFRDPDRNLLALMSEVRPG
jgi:methylmalonyl-CoA/ethylmalonyl-CoA epimerase